MKKFFFRLETLLKVRKVHEGKGQRELAYAQKKCEQLKEKEQTIQGQIRSLLEEIQRKRDQKEFGLQETYSQLLEHLKNSLSHIQDTFEMQLKQVEEKQGQLKEMIQQRKVIEKLKAKHYASWRMQDEKREGVLLDEITIQQANIE